MMDKSTKKALFIISLINSVLVVGAIIAGIIVACKVNLSLEIYLPIFVVCVFVMLTGNAQLWKQTLKEKKQSMERSRASVNVYNVGLLLRPKALGNINASFTEQTTSVSEFLFTAEKGD